MGHLSGDVVTTKRLFIIELLLLLFLFVCCLFTVNHCCCCYPPLSRPGGSGDAAAVRRRDILVTNVSRADHVRAASFTLHRVRCLRCSPTLSPLDKHKAHTGTEFHMPSLAF